MDGLNLLLSWSLLALGTQLLTSWTWKLTAQEEVLADSDNQDMAKALTDTEAAALAAQKVKILSDKVYLYSYFNVLFKTPFKLEENVRINNVQQKTNGQVLRTEKLDYSRYQTEDGQDRRAFILSFYTISSGILQLPRLNFQSVENGQSWQSPSIPFASFRVDEGSQPLPVDVTLNPLPQRVYVGQNILLNVWAEQVEAIDQSFLPADPEFTGFLVRKNPIKPNVERYNVMGKDVYRVSLANWLLNPIEQGIFSIPAISARIMGLERQTLSQRLEVLALPPNPYLPQKGPDSPESPQGDTQTEEPSWEETDNSQTDPFIAIGQFEVSFQLLPPEDKQKYQLLQATPSTRQSNPIFSEVSQISQGGSLNLAYEFAKAEPIQVVLRITGRGNIHLVPFPKIRVPSGFVLLQSHESESLGVDFDKAEFYGWRERKSIYKAKNSGNYQLNLDSFDFFDPNQGTWHKTKEQKLTLQVVRQETQPYYSNLEDLYFSNFTVVSLNIMYWLQKYAFYVCLIIFLITSAHFWLTEPPLPFLGKLRNQEWQNQAHLKTPTRYGQLMPRTPTRFIDYGNSSQQQRNSRLGQKTWLKLSWKLLQIWAQYRRALFIVLASILIWFLYTISVTNNHTIQEVSRQHYLELLKNQIAKQIVLKPESQKTTLTKIKDQLIKMQYSQGDLPNISLFLYQNGLPLQALEVAYLNYFYQPLHPVSRRLVLSLRIQQGLNPSLPNFFFWPLQLYHTWKYLTISLFALISFYCIRQKKRRNPASEHDPRTYNDGKTSQASLYHSDPSQQARGPLLQIYRNYSIVLVLLLLSLSIPWPFSLAVNTSANQHLESIPYSRSVDNSLNSSVLSPDLHSDKSSENFEDEHSSWSNRISIGELVKIKGQADNSYTLVIGERQDQGWLKQEELFVLPES